jgi:hypothetical protein
MKLNYYTYTITFNETGDVGDLCIKDIIDVYCNFQTNEKELEKTTDNTSKKLYFAKASSYENVFYLMVPALLDNYRSLNKKSGVLKSLDTILEDGDSLEKITYVYINGDKPIVGVSKSLGGATDDDLEFYLNEVINGLHSASEHKYKLRLVPLESALAKSSASKMKFISEARVLLNNNSNYASVFDTFITGGMSNENVEVQIVLKRTGYKLGIQKDIAPILKLIEGDKEGVAFGGVHLRAKQTSLGENIKDYFLDHSAIIFDFINPHVKGNIEDQIQTKFYANELVIDAYKVHLAKYGMRITKSVPVVESPEWTKLFSENSYTN